MQSSSKGTLTSMGLMLMIVASVISLRGLPMMAKEGLSMCFYILFATIMFLIPAALVSAELGSAFSHCQGGVYNWVKAAFGSKWGFMAIWLQWVQNVVWYPVVLGFAASSLAYGILAPELSGNGWFTGAIIILFYWLATLLTLRGRSEINKVTQYGVVLGTFVPGILIIVLGVIWVCRGLPLAFLQTQHPTEHVHPIFFPNITHLSTVAFLAGIILLFSGVEVQAVHVREMSRPAKQFPQAMLYASILIFVLFLLGALAVAAVVPTEEISLTAGLMEAFKSILKRFHLEMLVPALGFLTAFGAVGSVMSWISGPSRGLLNTAQEGELPPFLAKTNANGIQINILLIQGGLVTLLAGLYFIMRDVSVAFFVLLAMGATPYLVMYLLMFAAALRLRYKSPELPRAYRVPGGWIGIHLTVLIGMAGVLFALIVAFFPPSLLPVGNPAFYVALVAGGLALFTSLPLIINHYKKPSWHPRQTVPDDDAGQS